VVKGRFDEQWLRLLDVHAALQARTYNAAVGRVTIAVHDPLFERNCGTWSVTAEGAERLPGTDPAGDPAGADLSMAINGLSAAYLGGTTWHELWACGQVQQHREGAIATADTLFASRPLPRCGTFF
jgi:predicted acetyltransferase